MIASRPRLFAASLTVLALALTGQAGAQTPPTDTTQNPPDAAPSSGQPPSNTLPPAIILTPDQPPADAAPGEGSDEEGDEPPPPVVMADEAATPAIPQVWAPVPTDAQGRSAYGLYLAGKLALMQGEGGAGADYLARAQALAPEQPRLQAQAFTSALLSGDLDQAAALAPAASDAAPAMVEGGRLVRVVQTFVHGDARAANTALTRQPVASPHARAGLLIAPWIAAAAGDWTRALQEAPAAGDPLTLAFARLNRAQLLEHRRRYDEAETELKALSDTAVIGALFHRPYGEYLERRGRRDEALADEIDEERRRNGIGEAVEQECGDKAQKRAIGAQMLKAFAQRELPLREVDRLRHRGDRKQAGEAAGQKHHAAGAAILGDVPHPIGRYLHFPHRISSTGVTPMTLRPERITRAVAATRASRAPVASGSPARMKRSVASSRPRFRRSMRARSRSMPWSIIPSAASSTCSTWTPASCAAGANRWKRAGPGADVLARNNPGIGVVNFRCRADRVGPWAQHCVRNRPSCRSGTLHAPSQTGSQTARPAWNNAARAIACGAGQNSPSIWKLCIHSAR